MTIRIFLLCFFTPLWLVSCGIEPKIENWFEESEESRKKVAEPIDLQNAFRYAIDLLAIETAQQPVVCERSKTITAKSSIKKRLNRAMSIVLIPNCGNDIDALIMFDALKADIEDPSVKQLLMVFSGILDHKIQAAIVEKNRHQQEVGHLTQQVDQLTIEREADQEALKNLQSKLEELKMIEQTLSKP